MAKQTAAAQSKAGPVARTKEFLQEVRLEMSKVAWPSTEELKSSTSVVLAFLGVMAVVCGVYDIVFQFFILGVFNVLG
jgi:preprotein translocase subunit SecE